MYLKMLDMNRFVEINNLQEVTDPIYLDKRSPTPNGLFSYEIFGLSQYDRSTIWAYIDLGAKFLHPLAAINFKRYGSIYENIIYGLKNYRFESGEFIEDPENGDSGIDFLYDCYDKIKWRETESVSSKERITFLKQGKDKIFIDKFPVCPPFYRDINENSTTGIPVVNDIYKKIISQTLSLKKSGSFSFFGNLTKANIQRSLVEVFDHWIKQTKGKNGLFKKYLIGRNIDYGVWLVQTSPKIIGERYTDMPVTFDYFGFPLHAVLSMLNPFIFHGVKEYLENYITRATTIQFNTDEDGNKTNVINYNDYDRSINDEFIKSKIESFIKGESTRFEVITLKANDPEMEDHTLSITGTFGASKEITSRPMTWTDLFYIVAVEVAKGKRAIMSRYPITDIYSICYPKIRVMSTVDTIDAWIDDEHYPFYPVVLPNQDASNKFASTLSPCNLYLKGMGGDYDGDSVPIRAIFTEEGNLSAEAFSRNKMNFLTPDGKNIRSTEIDAIQIAYNLTLAPKKVLLSDPN